MEDLIKRKYNDIISKFLSTEEYKYKDSGKVDVNGVKILEGSIINADGYNSNLSENHFHCVEFYEGQFGSDIYGDFDELSRYTTIEVIGHCKDHLYLITNNIDNIKWSGNLGEVVYDNYVDYSSSWDLLFKACLKWDDLYEIDVKILNNYDLYREFSDLLDDKVIRYTDKEAVFSQLIKNIEWYNGLKAKYSTKPN